MDRALIEEKSIDHLRLFAEISEEARKEKLGRPPINEILYWWTRKPLIVGRAVTLLSTIPSSGSIRDVRPLLGLGREKRAFTYQPNREIFEKLSSGNNRKIKVFDPFAGAGNLLFEAARLGLDCTLMDYNPVAYILMKAIFEYPQKYGESLADDVENYGKMVIMKAQEELERFYHRSGRKALHYLWCWCIRCPYCGQRVPLTNQMWLDRKRGIGYKIKPTSDKDFTIEIGRVETHEGPNYTQKGGKATCIKCKNTIDYNHLTSDISINRDRQMVAVVVKDRLGKDYEVPSEEDLRAFNEAKDELKKRWSELIDQELIPQEEIRESELFRITNYGLRRWYEFFNERQLLLMTTLLKIIREVCSRIKDRDYAKAIATYLALMLCKHVDYNCIGTRWHTSKQLIADALSFRSPRIIYNFAETNPFEKTSGSLYGMLKNVVEAIKFAARCKANGRVLLGSAMGMDPQDDFDLIITDPPYMDDVQYAELSEFFYVWLVRILKDYYPELPPSVPNEEDLVVSWGRFGDLKVAKEFYKKGMKIAFKRIYDSLKNDGLLIVFFAHSSTEAWDLLLEVLRSSKFRVISSYAVHTESTENPLARGKTSFMSSIILACRKILEDREVYFEQLMPKVEESVKSLIDSLNVEELLTLPITDLLIMAYGKILEEITQFNKIKSYKADFKPSFEGLVGKARDHLFRHIVKKLTGKSPNILGPETSFALTASVFYRRLVPSDDALKLAKAFGISLNSLTKKYISKVKGGVKVKSFTEVDLRLRPEEVDRNDLYLQLLYLMRVANQDGATRVKQILVNYGNFRANDLKYLVDLLIKHYRLRVNRREKLTEEEKLELSVLESISDVLSRPLRSGTLDSYL